MGQSQRAAVLTDKREDAPLEGPAGEAGEELHGSPELGSEFDWFLQTSPLPSPPEVSSPQSPTPVPVPAQAPAAAPPPSPAPSRSGGLTSTRAALQAALTGGKRRSVFGDKVYKAALEFLQATLPEAERILVLVEDEEDGLVVKANHGFGAEYETELCAAVLTRTVRTGRPLMMVDARQDTTYGHYKDVAANRLRSVLCVPFGTGGGKHRGLLYADSRTEPALFSYHDFNVVKEFARRFAQGLPPELDKQPPVPAEVAPPVEPPSPQFVLIALALILFVSVSLLMKPAGTIRPPVTPSPGSEVVKTDEAEPLSLATAFLHLLRSRDYGRAWELLDPSLQQQLPQDTFVARLRDWFSDDFRRWAFQFRRLVPGETGQATAVIYVEPGQQTEERGHWAWTLQRSAEGWRIAELRGGPGTDGGI